MLALLFVVAGSAAARAQTGTPPSAPPLERGVLSPKADVLESLRKPGDELRLSNETTITRWAHASRRSVVRRSPSGGARPMSRLRFVSLSLTSEIYGILRGKVDSRGRTWFQVRIPGRPNGRRGWAPADAFDEIHLVRTQLVVSRRTLRATLYRNGRQLMKAPVGVGKASTPTPSGRYFIDRKEGSIFGPAYGARILFTTAPLRLKDWPGGNFVGMHGTNQPGLVPGRPSHGCIRLRNRDILRLARLTPVGTPLLIR